MNTARRAATVSIALGVLLLTGCAGAAAEDTAAPESTPVATAEAEAPSGQTVGEACALMQASLEELASYTTGADAAELMSDPARGVELFHTTDAAMRAAAEQVTNEDVAAVATGAADAMSEYTEYLDGVVADPANIDMAALGEQGASLQAGIGALGEVCSAA
ncbi:hypothetical protein [Agromyces neolithicus]|uniref:Uncharacterized protein n=1 Tax=Agromyces neolithicus TaxID=269420 RepID=A0ABN2M5D1_9MICO